MSRLNTIGRFIYVSSNRQFVASVLDIIRIGGERLALVRVWKDLTKEGKKKGKGENGQAALRQ